MDLGETGLGVWIEFNWLRTGTGGRLLWVRWWTFGFLCNGVSYMYILWGGWNVMMTSLVETCSSTWQTCELVRVMLKQ
jgi:hypothetical protein